MVKRVKVRLNNMTENYHISNCKSNMMFWFLRFFKEDNLTEEQLFIFEYLVHIFDVEKHTENSPLNYTENNNSFTIYTY